MARLAVGVKGEFVLFSLCCVPPFLGLRTPELTQPSLPLYLYFPVPVPVPVPYHPTHL